MDGTRCETGTCDNLAGEMCNSCGHDVCNDHAKRYPEGTYCPNCTEID